MASLRTLLTGSLSYDRSWGVWAERVDGKFNLESEARLGQLVFENGGLLDDKEFVGDNTSLVDAREEYCGTVETASDFWEEWAQYFIEELNDSTATVT